MFIQTWLTYYLREWSHLQSTDLHKVCTILLFEESFLQCFHYASRQKCTFFSKLPETTGQGSIGVGNSGYCTPAPVLGCWQDTGNGPPPPLFGKPFSAHTEWDDFAVPLHKTCCTCSIHLLTSWKGEMCVRNTGVQLALENQYKRATYQMWVIQGSCSAYLLLDWHLFRQPKSCSYIIYFQSMGLSARDEIQVTQLEKQVLFIYSFYLLEPACLWICLWIPQGLREMLLLRLVEYLEDIIGR